MKKIINLVGIIVIMAGIVFAAVCCATTGSGSAGAGGTGSGIVNNPGEAWVVSYGTELNSGYIFNSDRTFSKIQGVGGNQWKVMSNGKYTISGTTLTLTTDFDQISFSYHISTTNTLSLTHIHFDDETISLTVQKTADLGLSEE